MRFLMITLSFVYFSLYTSILNAEEKPNYKQSSQQSETIGQAYFAAYIALDWDRLETLVGENASFADPTASLVFGGVESQGKEAMMNYFRNNYAGITAMSFNPTRNLFSGNYAIFEGTLDWRLKLQEDQIVVTEKMPFVTVLRIEDGLVVEHRDYADYQAFLSAHRKLLDAKG